jgi:hypothetical protein
MRAKLRFDLGHEFRKARASCFQAQGVLSHSAMTSQAAECID